MKCKCNIYNKNVIFIIGKKYRQVIGNKKNKQESVIPSLKSSNPLDNLDCKLMTLFQCLISNTILQNVLIFYFYHFSLQQ